jgi:hypothetical protein
MTRKVRHPASSRSSPSMTIRCRSRERPSGGFGCPPRVLALSVHEFLRRFLLHVLPQGFVRIRHDGLLAGRFRRQQPPTRTSATSCFASPASRSWTPRELDTDRDPRNIDPTGSARWPEHGSVYPRSRSPLPEPLRPGPKPSRAHPLRTALDCLRHRSEGAPTPPPRLNPQLRRAEPAASFNAILCTPRPTHRAPPRSPTRGRAAAHRTLCFMATLA